MTLIAIEDPRTAYAHVYSTEAVGDAARLFAAGQEMEVSTCVTARKKTDRQADPAERFRLLAGAWRDECAHLSSIREMALHPAYQQIVGMGRPALPLILAELERRPDHWFWALRAIMQEDPVAPEHRGNLADMAGDWLAWARKKGIQW